MPKRIGLPKVRFNLWSTEEESYLILSFQYRKGTLFKYAVGERIKASDWDRQKQRVKQIGRFGEALRINGRLNKLEQACLDIYLENDNGKISPKDFKAAFKIRIGDVEPEPETPAPPTPTFPDFAEVYYLERKQRTDANRGTLQVLHRVKVHIQKYARDKKQKLEFSELNESFYRSFIKWLHAPPRNHSMNYVKKTFEILKQYLKEAEARNYHKDRGYLTIRLPTTAVPKMILTFDQLDILSSLLLSDNPHLEKARDLFLIGAYTGLRFSDFTRIKPEHIEDHKGEKLIVLTAQKTRQRIPIPLHPALDTVLQKYGYQSPAMTNQRMNKYLKELGQMIGLTDQKIVDTGVGGVRSEKKQYAWEMLKTHVARRSFATNYYEAYPHLLKNIMQITGHTTERAFRIYIVTDKFDSAVSFAKAISKTK